MATQNIMYIHAADDGGIFVIAPDGRSAWVTLSDLRHRLAALTTEQILLSADDGSHRASPVIEVVVGSGRSITKSPHVHPDAIRRDGATALMAASFVGALHLVEDLLDRGAAIDTRDSSGYTALMFAANAGERDVARTLVMAGADVNASDRDGATPLMFAAQHGHGRVVRTLLSAGADPSLVHRLGWNAELFALHHGHDRLSNILQSARLMDAVDGDAATPDQSTAFIASKPWGPCLRQGATRRSKVRVSWARSVVILVRGFLPAGWWGSGFRGDGRGRRAGAPSVCGDHGAMLRLG